MPGTELVLSTHWVGVPSPAPTWVFSIAFLLWVLGELVLLGNIWWCSQYKELYSRQSSNPENDEEKKKGKRKGTGPLKTPFPPFPWETPEAVVNTSPPLETRRGSRECAKANNARLFRVYGRCQSFAFHLLPRRPRRWWPWTCSRVACPDSLCSGFS